MTMASITWYVIWFYIFPMTFWALKLLFHQVWVVEPILQMFLLWIRIWIFKCFCFGFWSNRTRFFVWLFRLTWTSLETTLTTFGIVIQYLQTRKSSQNQSCAEAGNHRENNTTRYILILLQTLVLTMTGFCWLYLSDTCSSYIFTTSLLTLSSTQNFTHPSAGGATIRFGVPS